MVGIDADSLNYYDILTAAKMLGFELVPIETASPDKKSGGHGVRAKEKKSFGKSFLGMVKALNEQRVLSDAECVFLFKITPYCEMNTNFLICDDTHVPMGLAEIGGAIGKQERQTYALVKSLVNKNVLARIESGGAFKYCLNPEIYWNGGDIPARKVYERIFYTKGKEKVKQAKDELVKYRRLIVSGRATSILEETKK